MLCFQEISMNWELITGISSVVIAFCVLIFTIIQSRQAQKHNRLSVKPHLTSWTHQPSENIYIFELINNGLGPALIESFTLKIDSKIISGEGYEPIKKGIKILFPNNKHLPPQYGFVAKGYSMAAKEKCTIVSIEFNGQPLPTLESIEHEFSRAELIIEYKSFYEEKALFSSHGA